MSNAEPLRLGYAQVSLCPLMARITSTASPSSGKPETRSGVSGRAHDTDRDTAQIPEKNEEEQDAPR